MDRLFNDIQYAARGLTRSPAFTVIALLTLATGIGANAAVFSFVNALLFRPAPTVSDPASLIEIYTSDFSSGPYGGSSYPDYLSLTSDADAFDGLAAFQRSIAFVRDGETIERVRAVAVSPEFFGLLGIRAAEGRLLTSADSAPAADAVAVLGYDLWRRVFGGDRTVIGRSLLVNGRPTTIVGIAAAGFTGLDFVVSELWMPLEGRAADPAARGRRGLSIVGRLHRHVTIAQAQAQVDAIAARLARAYPVTNLGTLQHPDQPRPMFVTRHARIHPSSRGQVGMVGAVLMTAVGLVLLIACANVANLMLSRATARRREFAIRLALGAGRWRLVRQLLTESAVLALAGGALALLFALWSADLLPSFFPAEQAHILDVRIDLRALAFTALVSLAASMLVGFIPALHALRSSAPAVLRGAAGHVADRRGTGLRSILAIAQVALAFTLLVTAGLLVRSLTNSLQADFGFATRDAVLASMELPPATLDDARGALSDSRSAQLTDAQGAAVYAEALERVRAIPGVESASLVRTAPLGGGSRRVYTIDGYQPKLGEDMELTYNIVDWNYFETMGVPIDQGRPFDRRDRESAAGVVIVNDVFARMYFGGRAVGRQVREAGGASLEIVGVARTGPYRTIGEAPRPVVFYPFAQRYSPRMTLVARTTGDAARYRDRIRREILAQRRGVAVFRTVTFSEHLSEVLAADRLTATLVGASAAMALLLAAVGVYGVIAYGVARRTREIGVRIALGARATDVVRLVVGGGLRITVLGIAAGVVAALAASRLLASMLYGIGPWDAGTFTAVALVMSAVALLAAWTPAHRAVRLDPITVLREE